MSAMFHLRAAQELKSDLRNRTIYDLINRAANSEHISPDSALRVQVKLACSNAAMKKKRQIIDRLQGEMTRGIRNRRAVEQDFGDLFKAILKVNAHVDSVHQHTRL